MSTPLAHALAQAGSGVDVESVTRPLLAALQELTGLSSTYLTTIDVDRGVQTIEFALNSGDIEIAEGLEVEWSDSLCKRALESGRLCTDNVADVWGDSAAAAELGIQTYASAAVAMPDGEVVGTLCGASGERVPVGEQVANVLRVFSRIIADALIREGRRTSAEARAQQAEARLRERAEFLAVAEHQLKTPLTVISGWSRMLQRPDLQPEMVTRGVDTIYGTAQRLTEDIERLLREAKAEVMTSNLELVETDLAALVATITEAWSGASHEHPVTAISSGPVPAVVDVSAVRIVLEHLIENAIKYSPRGGPITVTTTAADGRAEVAVRDHGLGLPDGVDVFAPFQQGDASSAGAGLGLHIVRSLVTAMGGQVAAAACSPGTQFTVSLPGIAPVPG